MWNLKLLAVSAIATTTLLAGTAWYSYNRGSQYGMSVIQTQWDAERLAVAQAIAAELERVRTVEQTLRTNLTKQRKEHKNEMDRLSIQYESALGRLSDRPDRPAEGSAELPEDSPVGAVPADGCTGASLFRPDAEFLTREAHRADQLRLALKACQAAYDSVRESINGRGQD
jgi:hypothetical protein